MTGKYGAGDGKGKNLGKECREREPKGMVDVARSEWDRTTKKSKRPGSEGQREKNRAVVEKEVRNQIGKQVRKDGGESGFGYKTIRDDGDRRFGT